MYHMFEKWKVKVKLLSRVLLFVTPWTAAYQAPPSMEFSRQEYWNGVTVWLSFIESVKAVVHVIRLASFLWLWFQCLPSDASSQCLLSYLGFSYLGCGVSLHGCSSKAQPLLLTSDVGYLLTATAPDLGHGLSPHGHHSWPWTWSILICGLLSGFFHLPGFQDSSYFDSTKEPSWIKPHTWDTGCQACSYYP